MRNDILMIVALVAAVAAAGCTTPKSDVTVSEPRMQTLGLDARDYNDVAKKFYDSLSTSDRVPEGKVVALGPVLENVDKECGFDGRRLQEKIMVTAQQSGRYRFCFAADSMAESDAAKARYNVMLMQYEKESTVDPEDLKTFGTLAKVDYLLFGRASSQKSSRGKTAEATYTFNWKLGNCENGLLEWADEVEISKSGSTR